MAETTSGIWTPDTKSIETPTIFVKPTEQIMSQRKLDAMSRLAEIQQWGLANPTKFMERFIGVELLDSQTYVFNMSWNKMYALWLCSRNYGKALALDTPIPTPSGYKTMGELEVGDTVYGDNGEEVKIIRTSPIFYNHDCYKMVFEDGEVIIADGDHLWQVSLLTEKPRKDIVLNTRDIYERPSRTYQVPLVKGKGYKLIKSIEKVNSVPTKCISVDNKSHLFLCGTHNTVTHNSTMLGLYFMTRGLLVNNYRSYICAGTSDQSIETFEKIVSIAKNEIESFTGLTDVFRNEVVVNQSSSDGFIRNPSGFYYRLYNGSFVKTLNSSVNSKRGKRAEAVCFDESGWLSEEVFSVIEPYTAQNTDFKLGGGVDITTLPKGLPNQLLYTSSASDVESSFYGKYKEYSKQMLLGSKDHFVADINCDIVINATLRGKVYPVSLLSQEKIDNAMRENREKAQREYYNLFTRDGGVNAVVKRAQIIKNSYVKPPVLFNDTSKRKFIFAYDPARSLDNSVIAIGELIEDPIKGWTLDVCNLVNFMDSNIKKKTPMTTPQQIKHAKKLLLDYNGEELDFDNIEAFFIDAGSGGAGVNIADFFMEDWYEEGHENEPKYMHRGLIDKEYSKEYVSRFPKAVNKIRLLQPTTYKSVIYEALGEMVSQDLMNFTAEYDNKGYLSILEVDETKKKKAIKEYEEKNGSKKLSKREYEEGLELFLEKKDFATNKMYKLTPEEELSLSQLDTMKEEVLNMVRTKREGGKDSFALAKDKESKMHDDRAYVLAMLAYGLQEKRRSILKKKPSAPTTDIANMVPIKSGRTFKRIG